MRDEFTGEFELDSAAFPMTGSVTFGRNALGEVNAMTVAGAPAVSFTVDQDPDRLLTAAGGMAIVPKSRAVKRGQSGLQVPVQGCVIAPSRKSARSCA